jgi:type IV secretory pathway VirB2 component (pilin)
MNLTSQARKIAIGKLLIGMGLIYNLTSIVLLTNNKEMIRNPIFIIGAVIGIILTGTGAAMKEPQLKKNIAMAITAILIVYFVTQLVNLVN